VQLPAGRGPWGLQGARLERALAALEALPEVAEAKPMSEAQMQALLRPWLGEAPPVALPLVIELRLAALPASPEALAGGSSPRCRGPWSSRMACGWRGWWRWREPAGGGAGGACAGRGIAAAVVAVAVRAGIAARRAAIALLHDMGARIPISPALAPGGGAAGGGGGAARDAAGGAGAGGFADARRTAARQAPRGVAHWAALASRLGGAAPCGRCSAWRSLADAP
jgi:cell division transport system permease protein